MRVRSIYMRTLAPGVDAAVALAEEIDALGARTRAGGLRALVYGDEQRSIYCLEGPAAEVEAEFARAAGSAHWSHPVVLDHRPALDSLLPDRPLTVVPATAEARSLVAKRSASERQETTGLPRGAAAAALIEELAHLAG